MTFTELYHLYKDLVYNLALHYTQNVEDAEEITQDVFVKVYDKLGSFKQTAELKTWIYRIAINQSLDFLKAKNAKKRWSFMQILRLDGPAQIPEPSHNQHPGVLLEQRESMDFIFKCLNQLPDNQRTVIILLKIEQLSQAEAAEAMNLSSKAVESLFQRAKNNLDKLLQNPEG
jgi:RNA polymerase sigma-70 factor (ECF subfamily)